MAEGIVLTGTIRHGSRRFDRVLTLTFHDDKLRCVLDALHGPEYLSVHDSASPEVLAWMLKILVIMENQEARARASVSLQRTIQLRHEATRRQTPMVLCPECEGVTEVYIDDRLMACPRCGGLGGI